MPENILSMLSFWNALERAVPIFPIGTSTLDMLIGTVLNSRTTTAHKCAAGSYPRLIDFTYHSTLGLKVIKKKKIVGGGTVLPENIVRMSSFRNALERGRIFIELITSDRKFKAPREGSKRRIYGKCRVRGSVCRLQGGGFMVSRDAFGGSGFDSVFRDQGSGCRVQDEGSGLRV